MSKMSARTPAGWKNGPAGVSKGKMQVFAPSAAQRRLLVELLATELDGDIGLRFADSARQPTLQQLVALGLVSRVQSWFVLTGAGRELAGRLAERMLGLPTLEGCA